ncbi:MAG: leucine-rich repeat protein [Rikenellaceae bacterium]
MKKIKNILYSLTVIIAIACCNVSCQETEELEATSALIMSSEFDYLKFTGECTAEGFEKKVVITTQNSWSVAANSEDGSDQWITTSVASGDAGINVFYVSVDTNTEPDVRYGSLVIASAGQSVTVEVEQAVYYRLELAKSSYSYDGLERTFDIVVSTNASAEDVQVVVPSASQSGVVTETITTDEDGNEVIVQSLGWISSAYKSHIEANNGFNEITFEITLDAQTEGDEAREEEVTVAYPYGGVSAALTVKQNQWPTLYVPDPESVEYYTLTYDLTVESNVDLVVSEELDWLAVSDSFTEDGNYKTYTLTMTKNDTASDRTAQVRFVNEVSMLDQTASLVQKAKDVSIAIDATSRENYQKVQTYISNNNFAVEVMANVGLEAIIADEDKEWLSVVDNKPAGADIDQNANNGDDALYSFTFVMKMNDTGALRSAEVTFASCETYDIGVPATLTLSQNMLDQFVEISDLSTLQATQPYTTNKAFVVTVRSTDDALDVTTPAWITATSDPAFTRSAIDADQVYTYTYTYTIAENFTMDAEERNGDLIFASADDATYKDEVTITQSARVPEVTILDKAAIEAERYIFNFGSLNITLETDVVLTPSVPTGWTISPETSGGVDGTAKSCTFEITVPDNTLASDVVESVLFENTLHGVSESVTITQEALPTTATITSYVSGTMETMIADMQSTGALANDLTTYSRVVVEGANIGSTDFAVVTSKFTNMEYFDISATLSTEVPGSAFLNNSKLKQIILPQTILTIQGSAFNGCSNLLAIDIPSEVETINGSAFAYCTSLTAVKIPKSVTTLGASTFSYCSKLTDVELEAGLAVIGQNTFLECKALESITIPSSIQTWAPGVASSTFKNCTALKTVVFEEGLTTIGSVAFFGCTALEAINLPSTLSTWEINASSQSLAFQNCTGATSISIPEGIKEIGALAFSACEGLTTVTIPASVVSWPKSSADVNQAFQTCTGLKSVVLADGLTTICSNVFQGATNISSLTSYSSTPPTITGATVASVADCFYIINATKLGCAIYIPAGTSAAYQAATGWSLQTNYIELTE